jgi:hypothetical protein
MNKRRAVTILRVILGGLRVLGLCGVLILLLTRGFGWGTGLVLMATIAVSVAHAFTSQVLWSRWMKEVH